MEVSLVIPAYNEEKYIGACLESILKHAPGAFKEIIVVDNASSDRTGEIARGYPGVRVVREERRGTGFARDTGWRATSAPLVAFIDADTHVRAGWVERALRAFTHDTRLACLTGPYWFYDLPLVERWLIWANWHGVIIGNLFTGPLVVGGNFFMRRSVLEAMGGFDTSITFYGDDIDIARRAGAYGRVRFRFNLVLDSSGRRYRATGTLRLLARYIKNGFVGTFFGKQYYTEGYEEVR